MPGRKSLVAIGATAGASLLLVAGIASAQPPSGGTLVEKISQKFNLDKAEVQKVFDQERSERQSQHQKRYEERLAQAVKEGKLTEAQKAMLLTKHKELQAQMQKKHEVMRSKRENLENKTQAERQQMMDQKRSEMNTLRAEIEKWEKDNSIPTGYLSGGKSFGPGGHGGPGWSGR